MQNLRVSAQDLAKGQFVVDGGDGSAKEVVDLSAFKESEDIKDKDSSSGSPLKEDKKDKENKGGLGEQKDKGEDKQ